MVQVRSTIKDVDRDALSGAVIEVVTVECIREIFGPRHKVQMTVCSVLIHDRRRRIFSARSAFLADTSDLLELFSTGVETTQSFFGQTYIGHVGNFHCRVHSETRDTPVVQA